MRAWLDESAFSAEIRGFLNELASITDKVVWTEQPAKEAADTVALPAMELLDHHDGTTRGRAAASIFMACRAGMSSIPL